MTSTIDLEKRKGTVIHEPHDLIFGFILGWVIPLIVLALMDLRDLLILVAASWTVVILMVLSGC